MRRTLRLGEDLPGGALARLEGAVHVAVPARRGLRPGPTDASDGRAQGGSVLRPHTGREVRAVAAACPLLGGPVELDVVDAPARAIAEQADERTQDGVPTFPGRDEPEPARLGTFEERDEDPGPAGRRRVVERDLHRAVGARRLTREPVVAPERRV